MRHFLLAISTVVCACGGGDPDVEVECTVTPPQVARVRDPQVPGGSRDVRFPVPPCGREPVMGALEHVPD